MSTAWVYDCQTMLLIWSSIEECGGECTWSGPGAFSTLFICSSAPVACMWNGEGLMGRTKKQRRRKQGRAARQVHFKRLFYGVFKPHKHNIFILSSWISLGLWFLCQGETLLLVAVCALCTWGRCREPLPLLQVLFLHHSRLGEMLIQIQTSHFCSVNYLLPKTWISCCWWRHGNRV